MNYAKYYDVDVVNGQGIRCTLFVTGCDLNCKGCYNKSLQNPNSGYLFDDEMEQRIIDDLNDTRIKRKGLSILGGEPLHEANLEGLFKLVRRVRSDAPDKDIWLWTGHTIGELNKAQRELLRDVDVIIDGRYIEELADPSLLWRGSSNQKIYRRVDGKFKN